MLFGNCLLRRTIRSRDTAALTDISTPCTTGSAVSLPSSSLSFLSCGNLILGDQRHAELVNGDDAVSHVWRSVEVERRQKGRNLVHGNLNSRVLFQMKTRKFEKRREFR